MKTRFRAVIVQFALVFCGPLLLHAQILTNGDFEKGAEADLHDMDIVGLTLRPEADGSYHVIGVAAREGKALVEGVELGDVLIRVGDLAVTGATMGTVVDALRGEPGDSRDLELERDGKRFRIEAKVERFL